ncbi:F-box protein [Morus notabilis]|uniref:F-box protein n=1 Tax=Morus notabilis TaxID=981085 RepID=W9RY39_9ROSA|nr:F-box protein At4g22390 [Morus notabilis]EXB77046.1 F-box protein [Morus notabilis]
MDSPYDIPFDVILNEILTRTSPETVGRCRAVCKRLKEDTYHSSFTKLFLQRTRTVSGFFIQTLRSNKRSCTFISMDTKSKLSLSFLPRHMKIKASTKQGLLLCKIEKFAKSMIPQYIVCKPTTQQWWKIPNPKTRYFTRKTAMVVLGSNPLRFKIVRFSEPNNPCRIHKSTLFNVLRCEVFDSKTWSWKCLPENIIFPYVETLDLKPYVVSTSGSLHSLTTEKRIFAFNFERESWEIFALPYPLCEDDYYKRYDNIHLVECEGKLGLICMAREEECMELWVVEEYYGQRTWTKRHKISLERLMREERHISPEALSNNDVALMKSLSKVVLYNFQTSTSEIVKMENLLLLGDNEFFPIESDWEPLEFLDVYSKRLSTSS